MEGGNDGTWFLDYTLGERKKGNTCVRAYVSIRFDSIPISVIIRILSKRK